MYRLITRRPIYRAFRELDRFSDEQCDAYMAQVSVKETYTGGLVLVATVAVGLMLGFWMVYFEAIQYGLAGLLGLAMNEDTANFAALGLTLFAALLSMCLIVLIIRDAMLSWFLHRRVSDRLRRSRCRDCGYLLLGQRMVNRYFVHCPECGSQWTLKDLELDSPDDLLPELRPED